MTKDKYKEQAANSTALAFREKYPEIYEQTGAAEVFDPEFVYDSFEAPRDPSMGRFALPVFRFARLLKDKPEVISSQVSGSANLTFKELGPNPVLTTIPVGGFINYAVDPVQLAGDTLGKILSEINAYGNSDLGQKQKFLVEYSSPNIAKPFGVGHLRSTVLGNSLRRIYRKLGYDVIGINYPGDWGTQFGKMIVAFQLWGDKAQLESEGVKYLVSLYVRFHKAEESDPALSDRARQAFKDLESGETGAVKLWELFKSISQQEFDRVYSILGVEFDLVYGESFLNDKMEAAIKRFEAAGLVSNSQGARVIMLDDDRLPPVLLRKADGATLYATRDLAGLLYRWDKFKFHESLYIVNSSQSDHFSQCFKAIEQLEEAEKIAPDQRMTGRVKHVDFGWVRLGGRMMSTREGNVVLLDDVISEATSLAKEKIREKNPNLAAIDDTARTIGVGAVMFSQLSVRRQKDVDFNWEDILSFEGETGPYLQYTHARLCSLLRKYNDEVSETVDFARLNHPEENRVVELLADFPEIIEKAGETYEPFLISAYLLKLAGSFNKVYQRKDEQGNIDRIISEDQNLTAARMALVRSVQIVINEGLRLLGLQAPEEM